MEENTSKVYVEPAGSQPPVVSPSAGDGTQLFVINLCASIAPVPINGRNIPGLENYKLYQVARVEDGRTRHRLRLGFFTNEAHAQRVLTVVRQQYPTAFTTSLSNEDRRHARGYLPERAATPAAAPAPALRPAVAVVNTPPAPAAAPAPVQATASVAPPARATSVQTPAAVAAKPAVAPASKPAAAKPAQPAKAQPVAAKKNGDEVVEMTWEPDEETKAAASSTRLPKLTAALMAAGLDDMSWDEEPAPPPNSTSPGKEPLAVGLLSGKFAALDPNKIRAGRPAAQPTARPTTRPTARPTDKSAAKPVTPPAPQAVPPKLDTGSSVRVPALTFSDPVPTPANVHRPKGPAVPYHVGKGMKIEDVEDFELDLFEDQPRFQSPAPAGRAPAVTNKSAPLANKPATAKPAAAKPAAPAAPVAKKSEPIARPAAPAAAKPAPAAVKPAAPAMPGRDPALVHPNLDSTQTIRALTTEEMNEAVQDKWFAIQLAVSEQPVNLDTMPHLDIFEAYSLYSVASAGSGKILHSLRLGFFKEEVSAEAVSGYLKTFFTSPSVIRISIAEQARFKDAPQPQRAEPAPEEPKSNVVELNNARAGRPPVVPTVTMAVEPGNGSFRPNATGTFRPGATGALKNGSFKPGATGAFKLNGTGVHKALMADGRIAAKAAAPAMKRSEPTRASSTGKHKMLKKSLAEELLEEAREVELSESGIRKAPQNGSLLSRLLGKKK